MWEGDLVAIHQDMKLLFQVLGLSFEHINEHADEAKKGKPLLFFYANEIADNKAFSPQRFLIIP